MSKIEKNRLQVTEMFMAKADPTRCFFGIIKRWNDSENNSVVFSKIIMPDGFLWAQASDQKTLGKSLDKICCMVLDENLHGNHGISVKIFDADFFLN
jgi:hypothetical protein